MNEITVQPIPAHDLGPGMRVGRVVGPTDATALDPFLMIDCFTMAEPHFPPHPHAGFSAVTYLLRHSPGKVLNRDSRGDHTVIEPGGLHWTEAASGMMHEETPFIRGTACEGLQVFVNLPARDKHAPPAVYHAGPQEMPAIAGPGSRTRVLVGRYEGKSSPVLPRTPCTWLDVEIDAGASVSVSVPAGWNRFGLLVRGQLQGSPIDVTGGVPASVWLPRMEQVTLRAASRGATLVLFMGAPLREPVAAGGPFVMSTAEELSQARRRYAEGLMGRLAPRSSAA